MKRIIPTLLAMVMFLSACASPAVTSPSPIEQAESTVTSQPVDANPATAEPVQPPTPVPPPARWYWGFDRDTKKVIGVNQLGERRETEALDLADDLIPIAVSLDHERALLFLDSNDTLRLYLLTPDGMQKIKLPSEPFPFNTDYSQPGRAVVAAYADSAVFTYVTWDAAQSEVVGAVNAGPVYFVDLRSLTATLIDQQANRNPFDGSGDRHWFHISQDGRFLRYLNGIADSRKIEIRELDLATGAARTVHVSEGPPDRIYASPGGDLWYPRNENIILDVNGNQIDFTDKTRMASPLRDGRILVYAWNCLDACEMNVVAPFGNDAALTYSLPWAIEGSTSYVEVRQVLPDQSLLFAGPPYVGLSNVPAIVKTYPGLEGGDIPLFRMTPDGQARLVGLYVEGVFTKDVSADGRYILMQTIDKTSFFIYDAVADRPLFEMPLDPELEDYLATITFLDDGILVNLNASVPGTKHAVYRSFYYVYDFKTSAALNWEDVNLQITDCPDLLEDGSLVCWFVNTDTANSDLVRYNPATGARTVLLENVWGIETFPTP
ncbi:MAG: hypothetical protein K8S20_14720 [Chloroflexi bacterium]|nr:hypothetical protein [Chloroflexota bacterium]